jgi:hypothetical protein
MLAFLIFLRKMNYALSFADRGERGEGDLKDKK